MICFLTSSPYDPDAASLNPDNGFVDLLRACLPRPCTTLFVSSDPDGWEKTDYYAEVTQKLFEEAGFRMRSFTTLDHRNHANAAEGHAHIAQSTHAKAMARATRRTRRRVVQIRESVIMASSEPPPR